MWVLLHIDDPLAARVQQQLAAGHAWAGRHVGCVDGVHVAALEQGVLLGVDRLTAIEVRATWRLSPRASMGKPDRVPWVMLVAVRKTGRDAVVPC
jgi:hypothetical protein